jgi:hypothetical protein
LILNSAADSFDELVRILPGVWPRDVASSIDRLHHRKHLSEGRSLRLNSRTPTMAPAPAVPWLSPPHPLDADWRFTATTSNALLDFAVTYTSDEPVLLLGAPSLAVAADREAVPAILVDKDPLRLAQLHASLPGVGVVEADLLHGGVGVEGNVRVVVADPPWYVSDYHAFIRAASQVLAVGGRLILVVPAAGTRPGVATEIGSVVKFASTVGLVVTDMAVPIPRYESPPFEQAALAADGLDELPFDWRSAEALVFSKESSVDVTQLGRAYFADATVGWVEYASSRSRVRIRTKGAAHQAGPVLTSLVDEDVLPSVSRRHPLWHAADIWTTGNRVFSTSAPEQLVAFLAGSADPSVADDQELCDAVDSLRGTLAMEDSALLQKGWR